MSSLPKLLFHLATLHGCIVSSQRCKSIRDALTGQNAAATAAHGKFCQPVDKACRQACSNVHVQDISHGSVDPPLQEESQDFLSKVLIRAFRTWRPDVKLQLGDEVLPAHRILLEESSSVLKDMFDIEASLTDHHSRLSTPFMPTARLCDTFPLQH